MMSSRGSAGSWEITSTSNRCGPLKVSRPCMAATMNAWSGRARAVKWSEVMRCSEGGGERFGAGRAQRRSEISKMAPEAAVIRFWVALRAVTGVRV